MIDLSVVVPVFRNAGTLSELHRRVVSTLEAENFTFELILVNDACPEGSREVISTLEQIDERVRCVVMPSNTGQHRALLSGIRVATGRWTVLMDADLQDPPEAIPSLIREGERGYPAVFSERRGDYESAYRMFSGKLYRLLLHLMTGLPRGAGAFVAMRREVVDRLLRLEGPEPFIVPMIWCTGLPTSSVPVERAVREGGTSAWSEWRRLRATFHAFSWVLRHRIRALRMAREARPTLP
jgi:glycosyltransferase involved in cell wall biosynthesis